MYDFVWRFYGTKTFWNFKAYSINFQGVLCSNKPTVRRHSCPCWYVSVRKMLKTFLCYYSGYSMYDKGHWEKCLRFSKDFIHLLKLILFKLSEMSTKIYFMVNFYACPHAREQINWVHKRNCQIIILLLLTV